MNGRMDAFLLRDAANEPLRGGTVIDASALERDLTLEADVAIVGTGAGGGIAAEMLSEGRAQRRHDRGRAAAHRRAISACAKRRPTRTSTRNRQRARRRQGDQHPAGPMRRRRNDRQLDELVSHATGHARVLGAGAARSTGSVWTISRPGSRAWRRGCPSRRGPWRQTRTTRHWPAARPRSGSGRGRSGATSRAARSRLLRHGLPDRRQAVDAGDDHSRPRSTVARRSSLVPRAQAFVRDGDRVSGADLCGDGRAGRASDRPAESRVRARSIRLRRWRHRHAGTAAAQPPARSARLCSASGPSCTPPWCPAALMPDAIAGYSWRAADDLFRSLRRHDAGRRARSASSSRRRRCIRCLRAITLPSHGARARAVDARSAATAGCDRAAARRLPPRERRAAPCALPTTARRCSTTR